MQGVALGDQQHPVKLGLLGAVELEFDDLVAVQARQVDMVGMLHDLGRAPAFGWLRTR